MKTLASILLLFTIISVISISPSAFAEVTITTGPVNLSTPGCEDTNECYTPGELTISVGEKIVMTNTDTTGIHTFTSGTVDGFTPSPDGKFDSGILNADQSFELSLDTPGEYPYYCILHTWMQGTITVQEAMAEPVPQMAMVIQSNEMMAEIMTSDGIVNEEMTIDLTITDLEGNGVEHITYNIKATQGSETLLDENGHMHKGAITNNHVTSVLPVDASDDMPVVITVESVGFGHDEQYVESSGEIVTKQVVPEFGTIAMMILVVAIISIVAITTKSRLSIMPRI
ncbi:MAG: PEFG-CTERM sorting domain-containing protein [Nitrosopumilus sp.]|nr:PEFG-CTERM sorting domain-containing protein [Nitrosopumilus sp.]MDF2428575.1 PEFG-CTERM sorting domain-containing protein [Nitrosopumilus sp.]MDF2430047.1 PEFG-CTERM sorting domain-containing protein [Nitrosopumilus sp.]